MSAVNEVSALLQAALARYPRSEPCDCYKLLYQRAFAGGHLIADRQGARAALLCEAAQAPPLAQDEPFFFPLGNSLARLALGGLSQAGLRAQTAAGLFLYTAQTRGEARNSPKALADFLASLGALRSLCAEGGTPFAPAALDAFLVELAAADWPAVHHSETYRAAYRPAYRVVQAGFAALLPLLTAIDARLQAAQAGEGPLLVALDGPSGAGKSTLGALLGRVYGCPVFHMDDFFLPRRSKTPARLAQAGGNVHHRRFLRQVLLPYSAGRGARYGVYDCRRGRILSHRYVQPAPLAIVEGVYSLHPALAAHYGLRVMLDVAPDEQRRRILSRGGAEVLARYEAEWLPLENAYFAQTGLAGRVDLILEAP